RRRVPEPLERRGLVQRREHGTPCEHVRVRAQRRHATRPSRGTTWTRTSCLLRREQEVVHVAPDLLFAGVSLRRASRRRRLVPSITPSPAPFPASSSPSGTPALAAGAHARLALPRALP